MAVVTAPTEGRGETTIDEKVVSAIVTAALESVPGSVGQRSGLGALTGRNFPRVDLTFDTHGDGVAVDAEIAVSWPAPVRAVAATSRDTVAVWVRRALGLNPIHVNVRVAKVVVPEEGEPCERVTRGDLLLFNQDPGCRVIERIERIPVPIQVNRGTEVRSPEILHGEPVRSPQVFRAVEDLGEIEVAPGVPVRSPQVFRAVEGLRPIEVAPPRPARKPQVFPVVEDIRHPEPPEPRDLPAPEVRHAGRLREREAFKPETPELRMKDIHVRERDVVPVHAPNPRPLRVIPTPAGPPMRDLPTPRGARVTIEPTVPERRPVTPQVATPRPVITPSVPKPRIITPYAPTPQVASPVVMPGRDVSGAHVNHKAGRRTN